MVGGLCALLFLSFKTARDSKLLFRCEWGLSASDRGAGPARAGVARWDGRSGAARGTRGRVGGDYSTRRMASRSCRSRHASVAGCRIYGRHWRLSTQECVEILPPHLPAELEVCSRDSNDSPTQPQKGRGGVGAVQGADVLGSRAVHTQVSV